MAISKPLLKLKLLDCLRQSSFQQLKQLIENEFQPLNDPTVRSVFELLLHYAVQMSPVALIKEIVENWTKKNAENPDLFLDINKQDQDGNTPLHLAAFQSRGDVVTLLMAHPDINDCILNDAHLQPIEMCKNLNIVQMMQVARANYVAEIAQEFRQAFNNRDIDHLNSILANPRNQELLDINGMEPETGDTVLHEFVKKRDILLCRWILDHGGDPFKRDSRGKLPIDLLRKVSSKDQSDKKNAIDLELKRMLEKAAREQSVIDVTNNLHEPPSYKGYLRKWTNFAQGYKLRWFILSSDGILSYYKDQADTSNACRGSLNMSTCYLHLDSSEKLKFEIIGGSNGTIRWHLKGNHPIETNKWVWAIQSAIRFAKDREIMVKNGHTPNNAGSHEKGLENGAPASMHSLHSYENRVQHCRNGSSASSISSAELIELNSNLTESGKNFVSKVKNSRNTASNSSPLDSIADDQTMSIASGQDTKTDSAKYKVDRSPSANSQEFEGEQDFDHEDEEYDDEAEDEEMLEELEEGDEDVKVVYGPYAQQIGILQRTISIELSSLIELINENNSSEDYIQTARKSLEFIVKNFSDLNQMSQTRDKKLIKMLSKQRDINNLWIKSVKDLELELLEKGEKLVSLDVERKNLKKLLQKKLSEVHTGDLKSDSNLGGEKYIDSAQPLQEIVEFIENQESDADIDSEADEFFDAEDIDEEEEDETKPLVEENDDSKGTKSVVATDLSTNNAFINPAAKESISNEGNNVKSLEQTTLDSKTLDSTTVDSNAPLSEVGKVDSKTTNIVSLPLVANELQSSKAKQLLEEGTFLGYEDGLRQRLTLGKDNRPHVSLWSVLKSMVGKDMTRMTLPVSFNEPTSLLQRVTEDLEYADLLNEAASFDDSTLRLLYVSIFTVSSYASTVKRVAKPFNPLLGETFEYARPDKSYRFFTEQVSHHPPISATWTESPKWDFFGESYVDSKFNGRSFDFKHLGLWYMTLRPDCGDKPELYTYKKPNNQVVGILLGNPQVDNYGDVKIVNHTTGDYSLIHFKARGWRSSNAYEVKGEVYNAKGGKEWIFGGHWNESVSAKKVLKPNSPEEMQLDELKRSKTNSTNSNSTKPKYDGTRFNVWHVNERPDLPFNLTKFAVTLNAPQPHLLPWLPPTDTRLRPDQRAMEEGLYDQAASEKHRVEEKQRAAKKKRDEKHIQYKQRWFTKEIHPVTKKEYWKFNGEYWRLRREHKLANEGDIF